MKKLDAKPLAYKTPGNGQQGQFDGIYTYFKDGEERLLILEAKGGVNPQLGGRKDKHGQYVQQGTQQYKESVIKNMRDVVKAAEDTGNVTAEITALKSTLERFDEFEFSNAIDYQLVKQKISNDTLGSHVISEFKAG